MLRSFATGLMGVIFGVFLFRQGHSSAEIGILTAAGLAGATAATVAVNVTDSPKAGLALLLTTIVVVVAWPTAKATSADVLATKLESPAY